MTKLIKIITKHSPRFLAVNICGTSVPFTTSATSQQYNKMRYDPPYCRQKRKQENYRCKRMLEHLVPSKQEWLRKLQIEYEVMKAEGCTEVPDEMDAYEWYDVLQAQTEEEIFFRYRYIRSGQIDLQDRENHGLLADMELDSYLQKLKYSGQTEYSFVHIDEDCLESRQYIQNMSSDLFGYKLCQDIIIEFPQVDWMKKSGGLDARMQIQNLKIILEMNRRHIQPSKFHVSNCGEMWKCLQCQADLKKLIKDFPCVTFHDGNIFSEFKNDKLVYIMPSTPWSSDILEDNSDAIPILLLSNRQNPYNLIKSCADSHGIRHVSFPLHKYVRFTDRDRFFFSVAESVGVLQDMYIHQNWTQAFTNNMLLPTSKYATEAELHLHNMKYREQHRKKHYWMHIPLNIKTK
ncbi:uncharacterized protein LOC123528428 isoform X2 [Mercenaria mercenaria]|nr:uncharacterized protein LOC123528428 isoform X2 [Mercenaria mercenaria]